MRITPIIASIFSLLLSLTAFGQPSPINRRAFALSGLAQSGNNNPSNALPRGIFYWWVATDMPTNVVVSNQWIDRIQGVVLSQDDSSKRPTNSLKGVWFGGANYLTNLPYFSFVFGQSALTLIIEMPSNYQTGFFLDQNYGAFQFDGVYYNTGDAGIHQNAGGADNNMHSPIGSSPIDVGFFWTTNNLNNGFYMATSNGVFTTGIYNGYQTTWSVDRVGMDKSGTYGLKGYIKEIIVWTNSTYFSWGQISNVHWYCTNVYNFTP